MSASNSNSSSNRLRSTGITGLSSDDTILILCWIKRSSAVTQNTSGVAIDLSVDGSGTSPGLNLQAASNTGLAMGVNASNFASGFTMDGDAWVHIGCEYGPWDNTSRTARVWKNNGTATTNGYTLNNAGQTLDNFTILMWNRNTLNGYLGKMAEVAVFKNLDATTRNAVLAEAQTVHVGALTAATPHIAYRLLSDESATVGGQALTMAGTVTYDSNDHPPVGDGGGGGGQVITSTCFMHRETPQQHARRLGFTGWRGAVELRRRPLKRAA